MLQIDRPLRRDEDDAPPKKEVTWKRDKTSTSTIDSIKPQDTQNSSSGKRINNTLVSCAP